MDRYCILDRRRGWLTYQTRYLAMLEAAKITERTGQDCIIETVRGKKLSVIVKPYTDYESR